MKLLRKFLTVSLFILMVAGTAQAVPVEGDVLMFGANVQDDYDWTIEDVIPELTASVVGTGDLAGLSGLITTASFDFVNPSIPVADPLWSAGGFTFVLDTVEIEVRNGSFLNLDGIGTLSGNGYDDTITDWTLTMTSTGDMSFVFGTSATPSPVPEPATMFLLGFGLVGMAGLGRKKFRKNK